MLTVAILWQLGCSSVGTQPHKAPTTAGKAALIASAVCITWVVPRCGQAKHWEPWIGIEQENTLLSGASQ